MGGNEVIAAFDLAILGDAAEGIPPMRRGGRRRLIVPPGEPLLGRRGLGLGRAFFFFWAGGGGQRLPLTPQHQRVRMARSLTRPLPPSLPPSSPIPPGPLQRQGVKSLTWVVGLSEAMEEAGMESSGGQGPTSPLLFDLELLSKRGG